MIFDDRLIKLVFTFGGGQLTLGEGLDIRISGTKYVSAIQNECNIVINNLAKDARDALATQITPWNLKQDRKSVEVYAGRVSTGLFLLYKGDITQCYSSQPPDIALNIQSKAMQWYKFDFMAQAGQLSSPLSSIANGIGNSLGIPVDFQAKDREIACYSYSGSVLKQIDKLESMGGIDVYEDNGKLIVKDRGVALQGVSHTLSAETGMIGIPMMTEYGVRVKMLLSPTIKIGGNLVLDSKSNPLLNDTYILYKLGFDIASREDAFYGIAEGSKYPLFTSYGAF